MAGIGVYIEIMRNGGGHMQYKEVQFIAKQTMDFKELFYHMYEKRTENVPWEKVTL